MMFMDTRPSEFEKTIITANPVQIVCPGRRSNENEAGRKANKPQEAQHLLSLEHRITFLVEGAHA
ncbi:MAG: hypothetical protein AAGJ28_20925, partial [Pseudomonadota bacterium]